MLIERATAAKEEFVVVVDPAAAVALADIVRAYRQTHGLGRM
jgi:hypothetical protein